ncbi:MAG: hypothetical protein J7L46_01905 [Bacteroidales bacterium]|nr:hypothetical protein [Bacteroidales bacterium]
MLFQPSNIFAQSGQKWSSGGNNISNGDFLGTKNNQDLEIKVNNALQLTIKTNGEVVIQDMLIVNNGIKANYLAGNGFSLLQADNNGNITPFLFPNSTQQVLYGNGIWGYLPDDNGWKVNGDDMFAIPTGNVGIGTEIPTKKLDINGSVLIRDSLGIGVLNPQAPLDVQGNVIVRGWLYAQNGVVVGKRFEGEKMVIDTINVSKSIAQISQTDTLTSQKINASKIKVDGIVINGPANKIYSTSNNLSFSGTNLNDVGTLNANTVHADNLQVDYTSFDSLRVFNKIKVGTNSLSIAGGGSGGTDEILSDAGKIVLGGSPILTDIKIGIGTDDPLENLHIKGTTCSNCPAPSPKSTSIRIEDIVETETGSFVGSSYWDVIVSGLTPSKLFFQSSNATGPNNAIMTLTHDGNVGIGTENPDATLDINGSLKIQSGNIINEFSTDGTLADNSDDALPTEQAVKSYVDNGLNNLSQQISTLPGPDNLGNHTATENLMMNGHNILNGQQDNCFVILQNTWTGNGPAIEMYGQSYSSDPLRQGEMSFISYGSTGDFAFTNYNGGWSRKVTIKANGNVGIGTDDPIQTLDVDGRMNLTSGVIQRGGDAIISTSDLGLYSRVYHSWMRFVTNDAPIRFYSDDGAGSEANMTIEANGKVGIGTDNPQAKLEVAGDIFLSESGHTLKFSLNNPGVEIGSNLGEIKFWSSGIGYNKIYTGDLVTIGSVGVGTEPVSGYKLVVKGSAHFCRAVVKSPGWCPDFVFDNDYNLLPLDSLEQYVKTNKHLPDIPDEAEVTENGIDVGEMNTKLLQKVEELTLYIIEQNKKTDAMQTEIDNLKNR